MKKRKTELIPADYAILGLLCAGPAHGYDLLRHFGPGSPLGLIYRLEMSMLYAIAKKLEQAGLINGQEEQTRGRRSRRVLTLTTTGREVFLDWVGRPVQKTREFRLEFLLKIYFAVQLDKSSVLRLLTAQTGINEALLDQQRSALEALRAMPSRGVAEQELKEIVLTFRIAQNEAALHWLAQCLEILGV